MSHILIACARFYNDIADELVRGAVAELNHARCTMEVVNVPGAFELPAAIRFAIQSGGYDGYLALGCVIRGETSHYDYVCGESARGLNDLALQHNAAIGYGILTCENFDQAWVRADVTQGNKGGHAAVAALALIDLKKRFGIAKA